MSQGREEGKSWPGQAFCVFSCLLLDFFFRSCPDCNCDMQVFPIQCVGDVLIFRAQAHAEENEWACIRCELAVDVCEVVRLRDRRELVR